MNKILLSSISIGALLLSSCGDKRFPGYDKTETGIYYKVHKEGDQSKQAQEGNVLFISQLLTTEGDSVLFDSKTMLQPGEPYAVKVGKQVYPGDMFDALKMMHVGDSTTFCIAAKEMWDKFYKDKLPDFIDSASYLKYTIKVDSIFDNEKVAKIEKEREEMMKVQQEQQMQVMKQYEAMEDSLFKACIKTFGMKTTPTASGLYFIELKKGTGEKVKEGDLVQVNYVGKLANEQVFDASERHTEAFEVPVGQQRVIAAWEEALLKMNVGSKAKILCPSGLAYGPTGQGPIPPYAPLYFELEVVGIKSAGK